MKRILLILLLLLVACTNNTPQTQPPENVSYQQTNIDTDSSLNDFSGKPSLILFGGTYCPHCKTEVPIVESEIYLVYKDKINVWVNVIDQKRFEVQYVPQGYNPKLNYNEITGTQCKYVPSWVILDKDLNIVMQSCGSEKDNDDMKAAIQSLT